LLALAVEIERRINGMIDSQKFNGVGDREFRESEREF
jgi:hypothetical protein